ncbi:hypothetical protein ACFXPN_33685 [Streptomyces griseorubiginosus]|uniref:hypothetical protein n=1 Tax=Streptomyces griseorubiginosus TaxID=67304 RepID=UPI003692E4F0
MARVTAGGARLLGVLGCVATIVFGLVLTLAIIGVIIEADRYRHGDTTACH